MKRSSIANKNVGERIPEWKLTYIRVNCKTNTAAQISAKIGVSKQLIYEYCEKHGLDLFKRRILDRDDTTELAKQKGIIRFFDQSPKNEVITRPPAKYDNLTPEDRINQLLAL